ncbi:hypothetical protein C8A03DRAFT_47119 [Achaetomium macrosporum]|uniref:N-acetyltransferase domain-containing protein n=1 Tax=Achaetomium macrosporum TaxID=79813 RepID=A0AAN7H8P1_9PEZI|nr:hypothetical protein C8A03DRAFT_47119 [Achaetomium macrosporum]
MASDILLIDSSPLSHVLTEGDIILLLTPAIVSETSPLNRDPNNPTTDPFEPLSKALAKHHLRVRHVPYGSRNGITDTHSTLIKLAAAVILVISGPPCHGQLSQVALAERVRALCESRPQVILTCCDVRELGPLATPFPTAIKVLSLDPLDLEAAAARILFGEPRKSSLGRPDKYNLIPSSGAWPVEVWAGSRDIAAVSDLWCQCLPNEFHLGRDQFETLLCRDGYAMHYVVREPDTSQVLGFCATYTTYVDGSDCLLGSLAALLVHPSHQRRGIGRSLHVHALHQLTKTRGVSRIQLGSTFPRLLYGLPVDSPSEDWLQQRGWPIKGSAAPGSGQEACDWLLEFKDWLVTCSNPSDLTLRPCEVTDVDKVLAFVDRTSRRTDNMGWYDQYAKLANTRNTRDIILGLQGEIIIAAALTYCTGSPVAGDIPWPSTIADDVGGITCVCISDNVPPDSVMIRLLDTCIRVLKDAETNWLFIDGIRGEDDGFSELGFRKWARYIEVWREYRDSGAVTGDEDD